MTNLNNLFTESTKETRGKRALSGTAEMTANAEVVVNDVLEALSNSYDDHAELFEQSKVDANAMDMLISEFTNKFEDVDVSFLEKYDEDELKSMLKSQQSKRSRSKSKDMTMDNYKSMMNAAVCELMIRKHTGNAKTRTAGRGSNMYTDEFLNSMAEDQHELRRELRNVQSKMCIFRKKHPEDFHDFDEYKELERVEATLKEMRAPIESHRVKMSDVTAALDVDVAALNLEDAQQLIAELQKLTGGDK